MPNLDQSTSHARTARPCISGARCHNWRACHICAAMRQKRIADAAERLASFAGSIWWHTITPEKQTADAIQFERARWLRAAHPPGAIWTIEQGAETGKLHINILAPEGHNAASTGAAIFTVPAVRDVRQVAAYISKPSQAPDQASYNGRAYGTAGPLWQWLTGKGQMPAIQAAAVQADIDRAAGPHPAPPPAPAVRCAADLASADYRAIMARRLPDLVSLRAGLRTAGMIGGPR